MNARHVMTASVLLALALILGCQPNRQAPDATGEMTLTAERELLLPLQALAQSDACPEGIAINIQRWDIAATDRASIRLSLQTGAASLPLGEIGVFPTGVQENLKFSLPFDAKAVNCATLSAMSIAVRLDPLQPSQTLADSQVQFESVSLVY